MNELRHGQGRVSSERAASAAALRSACALPLHRPSFQPRRAAGENSDMSQPTPAPCTAAVQVMLRLRPLDSRDGPAPGAFLDGKGGAKRAARVRSLDGPACAHTAVYPQCRAARSSARTSAASPESRLTTPKKHGRPFHARQPSPRPSSPPRPPPAGSSPTTRCSSRRRSSTTSTSSASSRCCPTFCAASTFLSSAVRLAWRRGPLQCSRQSAGF